MPILEIFAIIVAAVAILLAWRAIQELKGVTAKLDRLQSTVYETRQEQRAAQEKTDSKIAALDVSMQKASGRMRFDPDWKLARLYQQEPRAEVVLAAFHIGGCASCAVDENVTLAEAVQERGANLDKVLTALNTLPEDGGQADLRMPNVRFEI